MRCLVAIPTFNRASRVVRAVEAALGLLGEDIAVCVVDDGSTDGTREALTPFFTHPRFTYLALARNLGTARAKNVAVALLPFDAVTFHDSDDIPYPTKLLLQERALGLPGVMADEMLNWRAAGQTPGARLDVGVVLTGHWHIAADGSKREVRRALSIVDDFFPNLQMNAGPPGDWILVNSGLFRRAAFSRAGGFEDCIEEDRELRNRLIAHGEIIWLIPEPLLTKIESADGLTAHAQTNYASETRRRQRDMVWARADSWRRGGEPLVVAIDLADVELAGLSRPGALALAPDIPMTPATRAHLAGVVARSNEALL